jgi:hypothetical protein
MLVQDTLTGYLHEVPDSQAYGSYMGELPDHMGEGQVLYDGFGNPVGLPFLAPIASALAPMAAKALPGVVRGLTGSLRRFLPFGRRIQRALPGVIQRFAPAAQLLQRALPGAIRQFAPAVQAFQQAVPAAVQQFAPAAQAFQQALPGPMPGPGEETEFAEVPYPVPTMPFRRPPPPGWIPRPHPYTGLRPRPVYMRCLVWRGPKGLVPARAAQTSPAAMAPSAAVTLQQARGIRRRARRIGGRRR